jgi:coenzyme F420 hydrogenase subunit beta
MPKIGPRGLEFARTRVEMKAIETIVHLRREEPQRMKSMIPNYIWALAEPLGLTAGPDERIKAQPASLPTPDVASTPNQL